jgi:hypothetical protein
MSSSDQKWTPNHTNVLVCLDLKGRLPLLHQQVVHWIGICTGVGKWIHSQRIFLLGTQSGLITRAISVSASNRNQICFLFYLSLRIIIPEHNGTEKSRLSDLNINFHCV